MELRPLDDRVVIKPSEAQEKTAGGIFLPDTAKEKPMIGKVLWAEFFDNRDWPVASAVAVAMLVLLVAPVMVFQHIQHKRAEATR